MTNPMQCDICFLTRDEIDDNLAISCEDTQTMREGASVEFPFVECMECKHPLCISCIYSLLRASPSILPGRDFLHYGCPFCREKICIWRPGDAESEFGMAKAILSQVKNKRIHLIKGININTDAPTHTSRFKHKGCSEGCRSCMQSEISHLDKKMIS